MTSTRFPISVLQDIVTLKSFLFLFGDSFSHQSVGEGDRRHLVLERCSETSMYVRGLLSLFFYECHISSFLTGSQFFLIFGIK